MKYLRTLDSFKAAKYEHSKNPILRPIKEELENEITWGGSLIGRLINSTIRTININRKAKSIDGLVDRFKNDLDILLTAVSSFNEREEARTIRAKALLEEIYKIVTDKNLTVEEKLMKLLSISDYQKRKSGGSPNLITTSYSYKGTSKLFEADDQNKEQTEEPQETEEIDPDDNGLIDIVIRDVKSADLKNKQILIKKLEDFKAELMNIEKQDDEEKDKKTEPKEEIKQIDQDFYKETSEYLNAYLDIVKKLQTTESKSETKTSPFKKGDIVMWKIKGGKGKGQIGFASVLSDVKEDDQKIWLKKTGGKQTPPFSLSLSEVTALKDFDEEAYKKLPEKTPDEIKTKTFLAKKGQYSFQNERNEQKSNFYKDEIERLQKLTTTSPALSETINLDDYFISENADDLQKSKEHAWKFILSINNQVKQKNQDAFNKHIQYISDLLEEKNPRGRFIRCLLLGCKIVDLLKNKYKAVAIDKIKNFSGEGNVSMVKASYQYSLNEDESASKTSNKELDEIAEIVAEISVPLLSLKQDMNLAKSYVDDKGQGISNSIVKLIDSFEKMKELRAKKSEKAPEVKERNSFKIFKKYNDFKLLLEADDDDDDEGQSESDFSMFDDPEEEEETQETQETEETKEGETKQETEDLVIKAWFKFFEKGEEKEWAVDINDVKKPIGPEKEKIEIDVEPGKLGDPHLDPIMTIMNTFGAAWRLYSTQWIPSGRPQGRVSQRTLREYTFVGKKGSEARSGISGSDYFIPGEGPWVVNKIFQKWEDQINKILENKWYRRVLANVVYKSQAEKETGIEQIEQKPERSSGITLLRFITELLTLEMPFPDAKRTLMLKYFNADIKDGSTPSKTGGGVGLPTSPGFPKDRASDPDKPEFIQISRYEQSRSKNPPVVGPGNIKPNYIYMVNVEQIEAGGNKIKKNLLMWVIKVNNKGILFRVQEDRGDNSKFLESVIHARFKEQNFKYKMDTLKDTQSRPYLAEKPEKEVFIYGIKKSQERIFAKDQEIEFFKIKNDNTLNIDDFKSIGKFKIKEIQIMAVSVIEGENASFKPVVIEWESRYRSQKDYSISGNVDDLINKMNSTP